MEVYKGRKIDDFRYNSFVKIDQLDGFRSLWRSGYSARFRNQSDCRICWIAVGLPRPQSPAYSNSIINYWVGAQGIMGRRENAELFLSLPITPCARAHHSLPAFARSFLLAPSLPIASARRNNTKSLWRRQAEGSIFKPEVKEFHYTDRPKPNNNMFIVFSWAKLAFKWVQFCLRNLRTECIPLVKKF